MFNFDVFFFDFSEKPRAQTPTERSFKEHRNRSHPALQPVPKPRSNSLIQNKEFIQNNLSYTSSSNQTNNPPVLLENNTKTNERDLMSFNSPEKTKNDDLLEMIHKLNHTSRTAMVPLQNNQNFFGMTRTNENRLLTACTSLPLNSSTGYPASYNSSLNIPCWQIQNHGTSVFSNFNSNNFSNFNTLPPNISSSLSQSSSVTQYTGAQPPPLPPRSPVLGINRISAFVNQLSVSQVSTANNAFTTSSTVAVTSTFTSKPSAFTSLSSTNVSSKNMDDLIDLGNNLNENKAKSNSCNLSSSILDDFDPLLAKNKQAMKNISISNEAHELLKYKSHTNTKADDEASYYEQQDPFEYTYAGTGSTRSDPVNDVYDGLLSPGAVGGETFDIPPPLPPRLGAKDSDVEMRSIKRPKDIKKHFEKVSLLFYCSLFTTYVKI